MTSTAFLYPGSEPWDAVDNWVCTLGRHAEEHEVFLIRKAESCRAMDFTFVLTEAGAYPRERIDRDLEVLTRNGKPWAVVHNHDNPPVPTPGLYPSFCWTKAAWTKLAVYGVEARIVRQPVYRPLPANHDEAARFHGRPTIGTFGHIEPKKQTHEMYKWARANDLDFLAVGPDILVRLYQNYLNVLRDDGCQVLIHPWRHQVEDLAPLVKDVTHFLFVLPPSKGGTGGSPTSPRYASLFGRPVIVVDDEATFAQDGYYVHESLADIPVARLEQLRPPRYHHGPDAYLDQLCQATRVFWGVK